MSQYLNDIHEGCEQVIVVADDLHDLSIAFARTGNEATARKLLLFARELKEAEEEIRQAVSRNVTERLEDSEQATTNMVKAALAASLIPPSP